MSLAPEEVRVRSVYLFLACAQTVEQVKDRLMATLPSLSASVKPVLERSLRKELGLLCRYWATRQIWQRWEAREPDAKALNLAVLRLFVEGLKLPKDGSGLRYAELSTLAGELHELSHRINHALSLEHPPLLVELQNGILSWHDAVAGYTDDALHRSVEQLSTQVKAWTERSAETPS